MKNGGFRVFGVLGAIFALAGGLVGLTADAASGAPSVVLSVPSHLVGNQVISVSGGKYGTESGHTFVPDTSVSIAECATQPLGSCQQLATGVPLTAGSFRGEDVTLTAGTAGPTLNGSPVCGVSASVTASSGACLIKVTGSPSGMAQTKKLSFNYPKFKVVPTSNVISGQILTVEDSSGFPLGSSDPVELSECDSQHEPPTSNGTSCDSDPANGGSQDVSVITGGANAGTGSSNGNINGTTITASVGSAYAPDGSPAGTDAAGGACSNSVCLVRAWDTENDVLTTYTSFKTAKPTRSIGNSVDASTDSVTCGAVSGLASFSPPLMLSGSTSGTETFSVNATLTDCTATAPPGGTAVRITKGTVTGTLTNDLGTACGGLIENGNNVALQGSIDISWDSSPALSSGNSVVSVTSAEFLISGGDQSLSFQMPSDTPTSVSGSFAGDNGGASTVAVIDSPSFSSLVSDCSSADGLSTLPLDNGAFDLGAIPTSIVVTGPLGTDAAQGSEIGDAQGSFNAEAEFPSIPAINISQVASWRSSDSSVADEADCAGFSLTDAPTCFDYSGTGPTTISATFAGVTGSLDFNVAANLQITSASLPDGTIGQPYDTVVGVSGGVGPLTYSWADPDDTNSSDPVVPGLSLNPNTGEVTGTPTIGGPYPVDVVIKDEGDPDGTSVTQAYTLNVGCSGFCITSTSLPSGTLGTPYDQTLSVTGGSSAYTWSVTAGSLPDGLSLDPSTGEISGTPDLSGTDIFVVTVTDSSDPSQSTSEGFEIII